MATCPRCGAPFPGPSQTLVDLVPPFLGGNVGPSPIPIYRQNVCARCAEQLQAAERARAWELAELRAQTEEQGRLRSEATAAAEEKADRQLPSVPLPGSAPIPQYLAPDWGWYLGTAMYGFIGGLVLALFAHSFVTGLVLSYAIAGAVLCYWLIEARRQRGQYEAALATYTKQKDRYEAYRRRRAQLVAEHLKAAGFP